MSPLETETIELLSAAASPRPLFVLLHGQGGTAVDMLALGNLLGDAFAESAVVIPQGLVSPAPDPARVEALAAFVRAQQQRFEVLQSDTALAGFGAGANLALALSDAHDGLVGRVLAFGSNYPAQPGSFKTAPLLTLLHLLHGQNDKIAPVSRVREGFDRLMALSADATLDVAQSVGHELHPALMDQAVMRLQTCVPLRHWRAV